MLPKWVQDCKIEHTSGDAMAREKKPVVTQRDLGPPGLGVIGQALKLSLSPGFIRDEVTSDHYAEASQDAYAEDLRRAYPDSNFCAVPYETRQEAIPTREEVYAASQAGGFAGLIGKCILFEGEQIPGAPDGVRYQVYGEVVGINPKTGQGVVAFPDGSQLVQSIEGVVFHEPCTIGSHPRWVPPEDGRQVKALKGARLRRTRQVQWASKVGTPEAVDLVASQVRVHARTNLLGQATQALATVKAGNRVVAAIQGDKL